MLKKLSYSIFFFTTIICAQNVEVTLDFNTQRYIGGISELDRSKFFNIHSTDNDTEANTFYNDYNVGLGRSFWGPFSYAKSQTGSVGSYPNSRSGNDATKTVKRFIITEHPFNVFYDGVDVEKGANWAVEYFKDFLDDDSRPEFFELMNEPFVHATDYYSGSWNATQQASIKFQMANFYKAVGEKFKATPALKNTKIIGYSGAYPSMEINDFALWNSNMKMFMDTAGEVMDGFSVHLYDGINFTGQSTKRSGANSEAVLDLIETYSYTKWGIVKPLAISEYGGIESGYGDNYSDIANIQSVKAINHILFNLLEREDRMMISIPFISGKAEWHITEANNYQPYQAVLFKPTNIGEPNPNGWEYTPRIHFYDLWKNVKGKRVAISSDNPDIQVQAFNDGKKVYVAFSNLDESDKTLNLNMMSSLDGLESVRIKRLKIYEQQLPIFTDETVMSAPKNITLIADETIVLEYTFANKITFDEAIRFKNYYTSSHLLAINANQSIAFNFNNVKNTDVKSATLKMSIGRKHNVSKTPIILVNGTQINVPTNWKGYDQANRDDFFGMIDIPVPANLIQTNNSVSIRFSDSGGRISSVVLNVGNLGEVIATEPKLTYTSMPTKILTSGYGDLDYEVTWSNVTPGNIMYNQLRDANGEQVAGKQIQINTASGSQIIDWSFFGNGNLVAGTNARVSSQYSGTEGVFNTELPIVSTLSLDDFTNLNENFKVYPNPVSDKINIDFSSDFQSKVSLKLFDIQGKLVASKTKSNKENSVDINVDSLPTGIYLLKIMDAISSKNIKIIKQ